MYRIKLLLTAFLLLIFMRVVQSQEKDHKIDKCGFVKAFQMQVEKDPTYLERYKKLQKFVDDFVAQYPNGYAPKAQINIPLVFHIVLSAAQSAAFSDIQITETIDMLNRDYSGTNPHSLQTFAGTPSLKSNTTIHFCLASVDTNGQATTGIERRSDYTGPAWTSGATGMKHNSSGGFDAWDKNKYLNIWICDLAGTLCGYGTLPIPPLNNDYGLVDDYQYTGHTNALPPLDNGGTAAHEIGHCFNLFHPWGNLGNCDTDNCNDTPPQNAATYGNHLPYNISTNPSGNLSNTGNGATPPVVTDNCTTTAPGIMYTDFMDYSDDTTYANFTPDQTTRMLACFAVGGPLHQLSLSTACGPPPVTPVANFTATPTTVLEGNSVIFTESSSNTPTSWTWSFPGGTPSTYIGQGPVTVTYNAPGPYDASLIVSNTAGSDTIIRTNYIHVNPLNSLLPEADFYAEQTTILVGGTTNFFDMTANGPTSWLWKFEDGIPVTSTDQNPVGIQYNIAGNKKVTLTAVNYNGSDSLVKTLYIHVISTYGTQRPTTAFTATQRLIVAGSTVYFTDQSTNNPASWSWTFSGLGVSPSTSNIQNPPGVVYSNPGNYNVKLKVTNPNGSDSLTKTEYIVVTPEQMSDYCNKISNLQLGENLYYRNLTSTSGYIPGPNGDGVKAYAEKYTNYTYSEINALEVGVIISKSGTSNSFVRFKVWGGTTVPVETSNDKYKDVLLSTMHPTWMKFVEFDSPVQVNGTFFVGFEIKNDAPGDTLVLYMANRSSTGNNTTYVKKADGVWSSLHDVYNINTSLCIEPRVCLVGINEVIKEENLLIYPNPSHDKFNIQIEDDQWQDVEIRVFDMIGKIVESKADLISPHQYQIDMSNHKAGIYFLNIVKGNKSITKKISVIR